MKNKLSILTTRINPIKCFKTLAIIFTLSCTPSNQNNIDTWIKPQARLITLNEVAILPLETNVSLSKEQLAAIDRKLKSELNLKTTLNIKDCNTVSTDKTILEKAAAIADSCQVQGVVYGLITRYGNTNVAFKLWLYSAKDRSVTWSAVYENSQPVFTDNIFGGGGQGLKYQNSESLIYTGLAEVAKNLENSRN